MKTIYLVRKRNMPIATAAQRERIALIERQAKFVTESDLPSLKNHPLVRTVVGADEIELRRFEVEDSF